MKRIPRLEEVPAFQGLIVAIEQIVKENIKKEYSYQVCLETLLNGQTVATLSWSRANELAVERMLLDLQSLRFHTEDCVKLRAFGVGNHRNKPKKTLSVTVPLIELFH